MGSRTHEPALVLVHSPLIGPTSWLAVADALERRGRVVVVSPLRSVAGACAPQRDIADTVQLATSHLQGPIILAGHSGAGLLLPVIADALTADVAALIFVDSFLPPAAGHVELAPTAFMDQLRSIATDGVLRHGLAGSLTTPCASSSTTRIFARRLSARCLACR